MRQLDRLILKELVAPWIFGVGLFSSLLFATTFLGRLTGYLVDGVPARLVGEIFLLLLPAMLVQTFPMAVLLSALLSFGRLSSDSEIVALRAAGASILRIVAPVMAFSMAISIISFEFNESVVPWASRQVSAITNDVLNYTKVQTTRPIQKSWVEDNKVRAFINARKIDLSSQTMQGVVIIALDEKENETFAMTCRQLEYYGDSDWRVRGSADYVSLNNAPGRAPTIIHLDNGVWPDVIPKVHGTIADMMAERNDEFETMSMATLASKIQKAKAQKSETLADIANWEYGYWNKVSTPLAAFLFGTLGAVLGIRSHRAGTATGFAFAVGIIFGYVLVSRFMSYLAFGGIVPAWLASFSPTMIGFVAAVVLMWRRNR